MNKANTTPTPPDEQAVLRERLLAHVTGFPLPGAPSSLGLLDLARAIQAARRRLLLAHLAEAIARSLYHTKDSSHEV